MSNEENQQSALAENISRKGNNSYYYAHGKKIDGPAWDGKEEPRLLAVCTVEKSSPKLSTVSLDSFSYLDGNKYMKIFVDFENADQIDDSSITLNTTEKAIEFKVVNNNKQYALVVDPLYDFIENAVYQKKPDKFTIVMKKKIEASWHQLRKTS